MWEDIKNGDETGRDRRDVPEHCESIPGPCLLFQDKWEPQRGSQQRTFGIDLNVNRSPKLLSREQNRGSKGRSQKPRQEMLTAGPGSGWSKQGSVSALGFLLKESNDGRNTRPCGIV